MKRWIWHLPEIFHDLVARLTGWRLVRETGDHLLKPRYYWTRRYPPRHSLQMGGGKPLGHEVKWYKVEETEPLRATFAPLWYWDGERIGMGHYFGDQKPGFGDSWGDDGWMTGTVHKEITHWAQVNFPWPPGSKEDRE